MNKQNHNKKNNDFLSITFMFYQENGKNKTINWRVNNNTNGKQYIFKTIYYYLKFAVLDVLLLIILGIIVASLIKFLF